MKVLNLLGALAIFLTAGPVMAAEGMDMVRVRPTAAEGTILNNWRTML